MRKLGCILSSPLVAMTLITLSGCAQMGVSPQPLSETATIHVDNTVEHQTMEGFGATTLASVIVRGHGIKDMLTPALRDRAIEAVYGRVGLTMGNLELWVEPTNDDSNPFNYNRSGFEWASSDAMYRLLVRPAQSVGFDNYFLGEEIDLRGELHWMAALRAADYRRYLDEAAEYVTAGAIHWRDTYGLTPKYIMLFNEPLSGNRELLGGTSQEVVDIVKTVGRRLRTAGFDDVMFIVPGEATVEKSISTAAAILADKEARTYVGAIAYHPYPYNSAYSSVRRILDTAGAGHPSHRAIRLRADLRKLASKYERPIWMTEVSEGPGNADFEFGAFENVRARAIHIHDELVYANASAFFGMHNLWDRRSHEAHFRGRHVGFFTEHSSVALIDQDSSEVYITGMGYALGHYARWIKRGAIRIDATSTDPLIQVSAFRDDAMGRLSVVIINNSDDSRRVVVRLKDLIIRRPIVGERSNAHARWETITPFEPAEDRRFSLPVGPKSIVTVSAVLGELKGMPIRAAWATGLRPAPRRGLTS